MSNQISKKRRAFGHLNPFGAFRTLIRTTCRLPGARSLRRNEDGAAAVEFALVSPFLLMLLVGIVDFGSLFFLQNNMHNVARESARTFATDDTADVTQIKTAAASALLGWGGTFVVTATRPDTTLGETNVIVNISVPMADVAPIGLIGFNGTMQTRVTMRQEGL